MALGGYIRIGLDVLRTVRDVATKTVLAQLGDVVGEESEVDDAEWWQSVGFVSRPSKPEAGKSACQVVAIHDSGHVACIASRDLRGQELAGELKEGETCVYAPGADGKGQARALLKADGAISLYTRKGNAPDGQGMGLFIVANGDEIRLINSKGYGLVIDGDGVSLVAGGSGSALTLSASGDATLVGTGKTQIDGSGVVLGSLAVPVLNSALTGPTGLAGKASLKVLIE